MQAGDALKLPDDAVIAATGCSLAELAASAPTMPVGNLARALGVDLPLDAEAFRAEAVALLNAALPVEVADVSE